LYLPVDLDLASESWTSSPGSSMAVCDGIGVLVYPEGTAPLSEDEARALDTHLDQGWQRDGTRRLSREFTFSDFRDAFGFATRVALLAEREFHHPELTVTWGKVLVTLWTHTVKGLSRNDFIIAAKIDRLP
jgi:4a-hydroxytetrahydrobiopterin dehydratase